MGKKLVACLLLMMVLVSSCAQAGSFFEQYLLDVSMIIQRSLRYNTSMFDYKGKKFQVRGCGPSSIVNALCISASVEDQNTADLLLRETMRILAYNYNPATTGVDIKYIGRLQDPDPAKFPNLSKLKSHFAVWEIRDSLLNEESIFTAVQEASSQGEPALLMGFYSIRSHWEEFAQILRKMADNGMENAIVSLAFLGCGTDGTGAPFRLSDGHYASVTFHCGSFAENTSMYLLDSNPRALPGENLVLGKYYERYALDYAGEPLTDQYDFFRISQGIVGLRLKDECREQIEQAREEKGEMEARVIESALLERLLFYGTGLMIIMIP